MADFISIETDISDAMRVFENLDKGQKTILRHLLAGVGTSAKNQVKKKYKSNGLSKGTGALYKSITRKVLRSGKGVIVEAKARASNQVFYGYALAKGSTITAKSDDYLHFRIDGKWVKVHEVKLPQRDFVAPPVNSYMRSTELKDQMQRLVQKEVDKLAKKGITV